MHQLSIAVIKKFNASPALKIAATLKSECSRPICLPTAKRAVPIFEYNLLCLLTSQ